MRNFLHQTAKKIGIIGKQNACTCIIVNIWTTFWSRRSCGFGRKQLKNCCWRGHWSVSTTLSTGEKKQTAKKNHKVWHINRLKHVMGPELCLLLLFVHAVSGSDTTSRLYGVGKGATLRKLRSDSAFKEATYVFIWQSSLEEIVAAG